MMQYQKESVKNAILEAAKNEFIDKGYQGASIRTIADQAGVSVSNIYNYFDSKDEILNKVLQPILRKIEWGKNYIVECDLDHSTKKVLNLERHKEFLLKAANFIDENRELLKVLIFKSYGSTLENYKEDIIEWYVGFWHQYIEDSRGQIEISDYVIRNIAGVWCNFLEDIIQYNIGGEELEQLVEEITIFGFGGWNKLVEYKKTN